MTVSVHVEAYCRERCIAASSAGLDTVHPRLNCEGFPLLVPCSLELGELVLFFSSQILSLPCLDALLMGQEMAEHGWGKVALSSSA